MTHDTRQSSLMQNQWKLTCRCQLKCYESNLRLQSSSSSEYENTIRVSTFVSELFYRHKLQLTVSTVVSLISLIATQLPANSPSVEE